MPKFKKPAASSAASNSSGPRVLYWFRTDLRLHDSPALTHALSLQPSHLIPLWTWDPHYVYRQRGSANRWNFLTECMRDVSQSLGKLNSKQKLFVVRCAPGKIMKHLLQKWKIDVLVFERDTDAYARMRDAEVTKIAEAAGVKVVSVPGGRTLFDTEKVVKHNGGKPTMSMSQLVKAAEHVDAGDGKGLPRRPLERPSSLPDPIDQDTMDLSEIEKDLNLDERKEQSTPGWPRAEGMDYNAVQRTAKQEETQYSTGLMGPKKDFSVPTLEEMGIDLKDVTTPHHGGETLGLELLAKHVANEEYISTFEKPATAPTDFEPAGTTVLSPHMHFGSVSCRKFYWDVQAVVEKRQKEKKHVSKEPVNISGQLLFRDMYFAAHLAVGTPFGQIIGNPVSRFIPWHLQSRYSKGPDGTMVTDGTYVVDDEKAIEYYQRWKHGRTGFPWIDGLMRQLKQEGWIHHLGRHAVACFLTRGGCYISWERGAEVFEEWLVDHEVACNAGNWMWLSCSAFFSQFYRCYSPIAFPKKWDAEGAFIRKYVPELANFDKKFIYEPHKAPIADQKAWGCVIKGDGSGNGKDGDMNVYPKPMLDFNEKRQFCIDEMKAAYDQHLHGDDPKVLSGEWKKIFKRDDKGARQKEEANGELEEGRKRGRDDEEEAENGHEDDLAEEAPANGESEDDRPSRKKAAKKGKQQTKLDSMVSRGKSKR